MERESYSSNFELDPRDIIEEEFVYYTLNKSEIRAKEHIFHLHPSSYGKTYFLVYQGKLRQFKVLRTFLCPWNWFLRHNNKDVIAIHELEISGVGKVFVAHNNGDGLHFVCKTYYSVEGYKNGEEAYLGYKADNLAEIQPFTFSLIREHSYFSSNDYVAKKWYWDGMKAVAVNALKAPMFYSFDGKDIEVPNADKYALPQGSYKTKEECDKDNSFEVEYFAENEPKEEKEVEVEITIASVTLKVKESKLDDVIKYIEGLK